MEIKEINVTEMMDRNPLSALQLRTIVLCGLVIFLDGYDIGTVSTMAPLIAEKLGVAAGSFGSVFALGFVGVMAGSLVFGRLADQLGRKWMIIAATFLVGVFTLLTPTIDSFGELLTYRFFTGIGIGGALPNLLAMTSEYSPRHSRGFLMSTMYCGVPFGGFCAPLIGSALLRIWGWHGTFYFGGVLPLFFCIVLIPALPESIQFLIARGTAPARVGTILKTMYGAAAGLKPEIEGSAVRFVLAESERHGRVALARLVSGGRASATFLSWFVNFMTLLIALFVISWLPTILRQSGLPLTTGLLITSLFSAGGVCGQTILGWLIDRRNAFAVLVVTYLVATLFVGSFGFVRETLPGLAAVTFCAGFCVFGAQACLVTVVAGLYPTTLRSTGLGWMLGIGRIGSIVGPMIGGVMLANHWTLTQVFGAASVPALLAAVGSMVMGWYAPADSRKPLVAPSHGPALGG